MKLIILDHFRRWRWILAACLIAYFAFQAFYTHKDYTQSSNDPTTASIQHMINAVHSMFAFQAVMWLGFLLVWDFQRGLPRVLTSLPVTPKQIGRAWWLASVAFPAIALGLVGLLAVLFFSGGANITILLKNYLMSWSLAALYLGAAFGALTFMVTAKRDTFIDKIRAIPANLFFVFTIMGVFYLQLEEILTQKKTQLIYAAYVILVILGWFRSERMVLQRASFTLATQSASKKTAPHKIPQGFGGLRYLAQRSFVLSTLVSLALFGWMTFAMSFIHVSPGQNHAQAITSAVNGGSTPWFFFILIFSIGPMAFQLRVLRTFPIPPSALAATLVFLPILSIAAVGVMVTTLAVSLAGQAAMLQTINSFLMIGAKTAIMVTVIVWRGLDAVTYFLAFLLIVADSFSLLGATMIFHPGSNNPEQPWWIALTTFLLCAAASFALTQKLLTQSSSAYRVRTMPANAWSMARR